MMNSRCNGSEELELVELRRGGEDRANIDLVRQLRDEVLLEREVVLVAQVADVHAAASEGELAVLKQLRRLVALRAVSEPPAHELRREDAVVVPREKRSAKSQ